MAPEWCNKSTMAIFQEPPSVDVALQRKRFLTDEVTRLQAVLTDRSPVDSAGQRITDPQRKADFRQELRTALAGYLDEVRYLKDWLRLNASGKPSEWELLGRAYRLLGTLEDKGAPIGEEGETLLSDMEMHVPNGYLSGFRTSANVPQVPAVQAARLAHAGARSVRPVDQT